MMKTHVLRILCLLCAFVTMTTVHSCYDDADLKDSLDDLDDRIEALEKFRDQVQSEITSLSDIINKLQSSVTINNVVMNSDGSWTINFSDGTSATIKDGEDGLDGLTPPAITIIQDEDGEYYWAKENEDGSFEFLLDGDGNKIPATGQAPMVRINERSGNWEISYDGGLTWEDTGMSSVGGSGDSIIINITEDDDYVYFHLRGGTVIIVPKTTGLNFEFKTDEDILYFTAGESRTLEYVMTGASKVVIAKPDGWKASIESEGFVITAPVAENTFAETEGPVSVIVTSANGQSLTASLNVAINDGPGGDEYDYEYELPLFTGTYYGTMFASNHNYYTALSNMPFDADGYTQSGGTYYILDFYAGAPTDSDNPMLPEGTYTVDYSGTYPAMTFDGSISQGLSTTPDGSVIFNVDFTEGTLTVSYEGDNLIIDGVLTDDAGKTHHIYYNGPASYAIYGSGGGDDGTIREDIHIDAVTATSSYYSSDNEQMCLILQFSDMADGVAPGTVLTLETYMYRNDEGYITPGEYTVTEPGGLGEPFKIYRGENFMGFLLLGSYAQQYDAYGNVALGLISGGSMTVSGGDGYYTFDCDLTTAEGYSITAEWSGNLTTSGMPSPAPDYFSTLTDDYTLDLEGGEAYAEQYGDYYGTGGINWMINILPGTCTDGIQIDLTATSLDPSDGIPSGTYTASPTSYPEPGEYLQGYIDVNSLYGTMYVGDFTSDGYVQAYAPATSGDLIINNHGDGTYDISFSFMDDNGHTWDGQWSGPISIDGQAYASASRSSAKTAPMVPSPEERAALLEKYGMKVSGSTNVQKGLLIRQ